jgi:carotenoid cleavage dioxygenase-like enzyme
VYGVGGLADRITKADLEQGVVHWSEPGVYPGEPVFVRTPGTVREDDGVLLSVVLDAEQGTSFLLVLDATDLSEIARCRVPQHIPFGFHGNYFR